MNTSTHPTMSAVDMLCVATSALADLSRGYPESEVCTLNGGTGLPELLVQLVTALRARGINDAGAWDTETTCLIEVHAHIEEATPEFGMLAIATTALRDLSYGYPADEVSALDGSLGLTALIRQLADKLRAAGKNDDGAWEVGPGGATSTRGDRRGIEGTLDASEMVVAQLSASNARKARTLHLLRGVLEQIAGMSDSPEAAAVAQRALDLRFDIAGEGPKEAPYSVTLPDIQAALKGSWACFPASSGDAATDPLEHFRSSLCQTLPAHVRGELACTRKI